ncbi:DUF4405 domain-containing protein [Desulfonema magnum]|uniref:DUF4405 n=1 Tax=Desulfonema magnum TaxID=45655 RepID=A0A975GMG6_9BACT|nr:DUF4405 domain-containing protein [Desulfonema magnum]QTA86669.1 DUF4405 [Desulfonema magnum]
MKEIRFRRIVSLTSLTSFFFLGLTGIMLYIVPQGRVAYWADWRLLGLSKTDWTNIHINISLLFLIASGFHLYYNWNTLLAYLKNKLKQLVVFNTEFVISLSVAVIFVLGTYFSIPPFQTVIDINDSIKARHERVWGSPPYGHAELSSLQFFCKKMELDADNAVKLLNQQNLREISKNKTLKEIAKTNGIAPQQVYLFIKASNKISEHQPSGNGSGLMPSGLGRKTLAQGPGNIILIWKPGFQSFRNKTSKRHRT